MKALNKQALRNTANRDWFESWFKSEFHPDKTGPYIKDQLFFAVHAARKPMFDELEAAENRIAELEGLALENIRLKVGISGLIGPGLRYTDADVMRLAADAQQSTPTTDGIIENIVAGIGVKGD